MPIPALNKLPPDPSFNDLVVKINSLIGELTNTLLNLDSLNVVDLTADHITSGTVDARVVTIRSDLAAGSFVQIDGNGMRINNGIFDTFTADVNGNVTMTRALIQSSPNSYPKVVMDPLTQLFGAYGDPLKYVKIESTLNSLGAPMVSFGFNGIETQLMQISSGFYVFGPSSNVTFGVNNLSLGGKVQVSGSKTHLGSASALVPTTPEEAVTSVTVLIAILRGMGILA